jgi:hypothetical protein
MEAWFSILSRGALKGANFKNIKELIAALENFTAYYNQSAMPFVWTKVNVSRRTSEGKYANLSN